MEKLKTLADEKTETKTAEKKTGPEEVKKTAPEKTTPAKTPPKAKAPEPTKSDRLDRMENQLNLIEDGLLVLINSTQWHNLSITPIGTHNPDNLIDGYTSLQEAVNELILKDEDKVQQ